VLLNFAGDPSSVYVCGIPSDSEREALENENLVKDGQEIPRIL
jgi:hypothetical protein